jgi:hypothetical protein
MVCEIIKISVCVCFYVFTTVENVFLFFYSQVDTLYIIIMNKRKVQE